MNPVKPVWDFSKKLFQLSGRVTKNASDIAKNTNSIKKLQQQVFKLGNYAKNLETELDKERRNYKHLQEKYELKLQNLQQKYESDLERYRMQNEQFQTTMELNISELKNALLQKNLDLE